MSRSLADVAADLPRWATFLCVLAAGVALSGLADFALSEAGYPALATYVWATGYAGTVLVLWAVYLRPIEFAGQAGGSGSAAGPQTATDDRDRRAGDGGE